MWLYQGREFTEASEEYVGFVYLIKNLVNGREYLGKKLLTKAGTKQVKGKKKKIRKPSDWQSYYGSNKTLQEDVKSLGPHMFQRTILRLCKTKGECSYWEAKYQFQYGVLENPDAFYNEWISVRVQRKHLKL